jgi:thiamine-phosphate pyrophosphorylase
MQKSGNEYPVTGFYPVLDSELLLRREFSVVLAAEAILEAGARILQFRHKGFFSRHVFEDAQRVAALCRTAQAIFVVNDRADIAMLLGAGVHLGQIDLAPADARRLTDAIIGFSTHNQQQLSTGDREPVDYLAIGPIFPTTSKQNPDPAIGIEGLRSLRAVTSKPLIAIGGITRETAPAVLEAGADSIAVIGDLYPEQCTKASLRTRAEDWLAICSRTSRRR